MKVFLGRYKKADVDKYINELEEKNNQLVKDLNSKIEELLKENNLMRERILEIEQKEKLISRVMVDATLRAKDIEEDYKRRAIESDMAYDKLKADWEQYMANFKNRLVQAKEEACVAISQIQEDIELFADWTDNKIEQISKGDMPVLIHDSFEKDTQQTEDQTEFDIEEEIAKGINTDLADVCKELGLGE